MTSKQNTADVYSKLNKYDHYVLLPDDIYNIGDLDFLIQRFNTGFSTDMGSRNHMEDVIVIRQQLGVSMRLNVSFFAVFDGFSIEFFFILFNFKYFYHILYIYYIRHGGIDCANYVAENLVENLRNNFLLDDNFDKQENFFGYVQSVLEQVFINYYKT